MTEIYIDPEVHAVRNLHSALLSTGYSCMDIHDRLLSQANAILEGHQSGNPAVSFHLGCWCADFIGLEPARIMASSLCLDHARETIAREHGYKHWRDVEALRGVMLDEVFENTVDLVLEGDVSQLKDELGARPELVEQRSQYGHRATLLHYVGANGVESHRQVTPMNAPEVAQCLIRAGADVNAMAEMYGGSTTLSLVLTSAHPRNAGVTHAIADVLKAAGAT